MSGQGKVAVITGSSSGIGRATAIALSQAGWSLTLTARREAQLQETRALCIDARKAVGLPSEDGKFLVAAGDITNEDFVKGLFQKTVDSFGRLDMLFNNAGISAPATPTEEFSLDLFNAVLSTNVIGPFLCTREAVRIFKRQNPQGGRIINNGSLSAHMPRPHSVAYTTAKHAILGLTKCTALDGRPHNITCTQIDIGNANTAISTASNNQFSGAPSSTAVMHLQPNGQVVPEDTMDPAYAAAQIVSVAALPNTVTVLSLNIMATDVPYVGRG